MRRQSILKLLSEEVKISGNIIIIAVIIHFINIQIIFPIPIAVFTLLPSSLSLLGGLLPTPNSIILNPGPVRVNSNIKLI